MTSQDWVVQVCCSSPERFLRGSRSGELEARPIKGTASRCQDAAADVAAAAALAASEKDQAENLMIVDLLRNDLGRVCQVTAAHARFGCLCGDPAFTVVSAHMKHVCIVALAGGQCACSCADGGGKLCCAQPGEHGARQAEAGDLHCAVFASYLPWRIHDWGAKAAQHGDSGQVQHHLILGSVLIAWGACS